jgi:hypothetical protein
LDHPQILNLSLGDQDNLKILKVAVDWSFDSREAKLKKYRGKDRNKIEINAL